MAKGSHAVWAPWSPRTCYVCGQKIKLTDRHTSAGFNRGLQTNEPLVVARPLSPTMTVLYLQDPDVVLYHGDAVTTLEQLPDESVHCVVTSPPYWGLRDYGTGSWAGGDPDCDHKHPTEHQKQGATSLRQGRSNVQEQRNENFRDVCGKCGATRTDQQLGLEPTPDAYINNMVQVFRQVRRVLRADGTCWLNLGDSMLPGKQLAGMPWRVAFALQADGWYLRADIIWNKPNPMPESVTDRPTKAHEYVFLLTRSARYFYDAEAIREPHSWPVQPAHDWAERRANGEPVRRGIAPTTSTTTPGGVGSNPAGRNSRSVWTIATQPYPEAHFATFPMELARRCILAGSPEGGTVLDPFAGSGTTLHVARNHGRSSIGIELNADYCALTARRLQQLSLLA